MQDLLPNQEKMVAIAKKYHITDADERNSVAL
jgi:hypothetical protein